MKNYQESWKGSDQLGVGIFFNQPYWFGPWSKNPHASLEGKYCEDPGLINFLRRRAEKDALSRHIEAIDYFFNSRSHSRLCVICRRSPATLLPTAHGFGGMKTLAAWVCCRRCTEEAKKIVASNCLIFEKMIFLPLSFESAIQYNEKNLRDHHLKQVMRAFLEIYGLSEDIGRAKKAAKKLYSTNSYEQQRELGFRLYNVFEMGRYYKDFIKRKISPGLIGHGFPGRYAPVKEAQGLLPFSRPK